MAASPACPATPHPACTNANAHMHLASRQSSAQIAPRRCGLLSPCLCSLPLWRAALRSSRSPLAGSSSLHQRSKSSAGASEIPPPTAALPHCRTATNTPFGVRRQSLVGRHSKRRPFHRGHKRPLLQAILQNSMKSQHLPHGTQKVSTAQRNSFEKREGNILPFRGGL